VQADAVVLAIHGITGNMIIWRTVARNLDALGGVSFLAPDLRGRGESAALPGPYGIASHVKDMLGVLDHFGVGRAVLAGHSMGAYLAARLAAEHPERVAGLVLVDGGPSVDALTPEQAGAVRAVTVGPALVRHAMSMPSEEAWLEFWHQHPAFAHAWNPDVEAYVLHDVGGEPGAIGYVINLNAVETDSNEMLSDPANRTPMDRVDVPLTLLRAPRGTFDDDHPLVSTPALRAFVSAHPAAEVEEVEGVNHYTVILGDSPGPARVAAAIEKTVRVPSR
ncbi:MAG TPA: alpha/beta hydrolase, partial [Solirubrobacteraceae bacterium]|nr:alpha/beta hydrolase [Solirubrobacteraceae bacterium]